MLPRLGAVEVRQVRTSPARRGEHGAVTAEAVMVIPVLVAVTLGLAWALSLVATQVRVVDAAREVARALARDEPQAEAIALGRRVAPVGAAFEVHEGDGLVRVTVTSTPPGPGGLFAFASWVEVDGEAVAALEPR